MAITIRRPLFSVAYIEGTPTELIESGYLTDAAPLPRAARETVEHPLQKVTGLYHGRVRLWLGGWEAARRDRAFRRFLDAALAR